MPTVPILQRMARLANEACSVLEQNILRKASKSGFNVNIDLFFSLLWQYLPSCDGYFFLLSLIVLWSLIVFICDGL